MTLKEYLLNRFSEECAEVIQRVSKALTFGLDEIQPGQVDEKGNPVSLPNDFRIVVEYIDLLAVYEMLEEEGIIALPFSDTVAKMKAKKKEKVRHYMQLSRERGTLTD